MLTPIINLLLSLSLSLSLSLGIVTASMEQANVRIVPQGQGPAVVQPTEAPVVPPEVVLPGAEEYSEIGRGASGDAVIALQARLTELGYYTGRETGKMDSATQLAFKKFEKANGFNANGVASPEEQAVLYSEQAVAAE